RLTTVSLPVPPGSTRYHVLGNVGGSLKPDFTAGRYVVTYEGGATRTYPLVAGRSLAEVGMPGTLPGLRGRDGAFVMTFGEIGEPPGARLLITNVTLEVTVEDAVIAVVAATGEKAGEAAPLH